MKGKIEHDGIIQSIEGEHIRVRIIQSSACSSCQAKSICSSSESKEKIIDVYSAESNIYRLGEKIKICASESMGRKAIIYAFIIPLIIIMIWIGLAITCLGISELIAIAGVFLLLTIYYLILSFCKTWMKNELRFWIEK